MSCEATLVRKSTTVETLVVSAAISEEEIIQLPSGLAGVSKAAYESGDTASFDTTGVYTVDKEASIVLLKGDLVWWDHSANKATYRRPVASDRDFILGVCTQDAAAVDTTCSVEFNKRPIYTHSLIRDPFISALTGTQALGGFGVLQHGGSLLFRITSTNEVQKADALSAFSFSKDCNPIVQGSFWVASSSGSAVDVSIGIANATHATDADSITESLFLHLNSNDLNIYAESDDGTTEVAATDTTIDYAVGNANRVWFTFDCRDLTNIKIYLNGARVLSGSTFRLDNATQPLYILVHAEKTSGTDAMEFTVDDLTIRTSEQ